MPDRLLVRTPAHTKQIRWNGSLVSIAAHAAVLIAMLAGAATAPKLVTKRWPGTASGVRLLTYYSPGSPHRAVNDLTIKAPPAPNTATVHTRSAPSKPSDASSASAERGTGDAALSGLGDGDMRMAYQKIFPYPRPDLSSLPPGKSGDVVLTAKIDEHGKVQDLTLLSGLGPAIDDTVLATVREWTFTPATRNGTPVQSEQEFHFHYTRA